MPRKIYFVVSVILVASIAAAWYFLAPPKSSSNETNGETPDLGAESPISVKVQYARQGTLVLRLTATGYTRAVRQVPFTAQVSGVVDSLPVFEGKMKQVWEKEKPIEMMKRLRMEKDEGDMGRLDEWRT